MLPGGAISIVVEPSVVAEPPRRSLPRRVLVWAALGLAVVPPLLIARVLAEFALDVPIQDQWPFAREVIAFVRGTYEPSTLFYPIGQHRVVLPKLVMLPLASLTHWDVRAEIWFNFATVVASLVLLAALAWRTLRPVWPTAWAWTVPLMSAALFSLVSWQSWTWGWMMAAYLNVLATVLVVWALGRFGLSPGGLTTMVLGAIAAGLSFISGLTLLVLVPLALLALPGAPDQGRRGLRIAAVTGVLGAAAVVYLATYPRFLGAQAAPTLALHPADVALFTVRYLGAPFAVPDVGAATVWGVAGLLIVGSSVAVAWLRAPELRAPLLPWLLLATYVVAAGAVTAVGRLASGPGLAVASRYTTISALFWVSLPPCVLLAARAAGFTRAPRWVHALGVLVVATGLVLGGRAYVATWERAMGGVIGRFRGTAEAGACLRAQEASSVACLRSISHNPHLVLRTSVELRQLGIGPFRAPSDGDR